jgi:hypothetical protein
MGTAVKNANIGDFLTDAQIDQAINLGGAHAIRDHVIIPNLKEITAKLGGLHDPMYLAFMIAGLVDEAIQIVSSQETLGAALNVSVHDRVMA